MTRLFLKEGFKHFSIFLYILPLATISKHLKTYSKLACSKICQNSKTTFLTADPEQICVFRSPTTINWFAYPH